MALFPMAGHAWRRLDERRCDADWLRAVRASSEARVLAFVGAEPVVVGATSAEPRLASLSASSLGEAWDAALEWILLGEVDGAPCFATAWAEVPSAFGGEPVGLREVGGMLPELEAQLAACATGLCSWHAAHPRCARCGEASISTQAGWQRRCADEACGAQHFPRTDPAVIVLAERDGRALLGRQASWPAGVYSTLAGFVEPGESLEEAVAREVEEESGVAVESARYLASQPWPFPASLMLGFRARAAAGQPHARDGELEDVRWFTREEVREGVECGELALPGTLSISRWLIEGWLDEGETGELLAASADTHPEREG